MPYCIDLDARKPKILLFEGEELDFDLKYYRVKNALDLNTFERRVFMDLGDAESFFKEYSNTIKNLSNAKICKSRKLPAMLYKRRYMALTLMGLKKHTHRDYDKAWKPGTLVNLHDQTFFLTVKIKKITKEGELYRYDFELA